MMTKTIPTTPGWYWYYDPECLTTKMPGGHKPEIVEFDGDTFWSSGELCGADEIKSGYFEGPLTMPDFGDLK